MSASAEVATVLEYAFGDRADCCLPVLQGGTYRVGRNVVEVAWVSSAVFYVLYTAVNVLTKYAFDVRVLPDLASELKRYAAEILSSELPFFCSANRCRVDAVEHDFEERREREIRIIADFDRLAVVINDEVVADLNGPIVREHQGHYGVITTPNTRIVYGRDALLFATGNKVLYFIPVVDGDDIARA